MTYIEAISSLRQELTGHGFTKAKDKQDLELLYFLSKAQQYLGNRYRLLEKKSDVLLQLNTYIYDFPLTASGYPEDVLEVKSVIYDGEELPDRVGIEAVVHDIETHATPIITKWSVKNRKLYINSMPSASYHITNNPTAKVTMIYFHRFLVYAGIDNYDFTVTADLNEEFLIDDAWMGLVIDLACAYLMPELMEGMLAMIIDAMNDAPQYRSTSLIYHLGISNEPINRRTTNG